MGDNNILKLTQGKRDEEVYEIIRCMKLLAKAAPEIAKTKIAFFKAYVSEGFTPEQAIELCNGLGGL